MTIKTICGASLAALAIAGGAVPAAHADTYCVSHPNCVGDWSGDDLQEALTLAAASADEADGVRVGPGLFTRANGFQYNAGPNPANALHLEGVETKTILTTDSSTASDATVLSITGTGKDDTWAHGLWLQVPIDTDGSVNTRGLRLARAAAEDFQIVAANASGLGVFAGAELFADSAIRRTTVALSPTQAGTGIRLSSAGATAEDVQTTNAREGVLVTAAGETHIRRARIDARGAAALSGIRCSSCVGLEVDNSIVRLAGSAVGLDTYANGGAVAHVEASHMTIVGTPPNDSIAVRANTEGFLGTATVQLDNSVLHTVHHTVSASSDLGEATIVARRTMFAAGKEIVGDGGEIDAWDNVAPNPGFVDQAQGDLRPLYSSGLVDTGRDNVFVESAFDIALLKRVIDGNVDGIASQDIGAYEYRALAPKVDVMGPKTADPGQMVTLDGSKSHGGDPGETVTFDWKLPDGTSATTPKVAFTLTSPGKHQATLTVTDPTGKKSSWTHEIEVPAPTTPQPDPTPPGTPDPVPSPTPVPAPAPDTRPGTTPLLSNLRAEVVRRRPRLRLELAEPATLSVRLERRSGGRWLRVQTGRAGHPAGARRITLRRVRRPGAYRARVTARTAARSLTAHVRFRVR
jgi:hypothetical protein